MISEIFDREISKCFSPEFKLSVRHLFRDSFGCVNAIKCTDDMILTGGDDQRILLYDQDFHLVQQFRGHCSNIFSVGTIGNKIYSTGNDGYLLEYDWNQTSRYGKIRVAHEDAIHNFAIQSENIILTAGQDFCCKLWDVRVADPVGVLETAGKRQNCVDFRNGDARGGHNHEQSVYYNILQKEDYDHEFNEQYQNEELHTHTDTIDSLRHRYSYSNQIINEDYQTVSANHDNSPIFLTCDDQGGIYLYDIRTGFTSRNSTPLKSFNTRLGRIKDSLLQRARRFDISSARFSPDGDYIACTVQKFSPLLFSVWGGSDPIAVLQADGFSSLATIKSGDFSNTNHGSVYYVGGDDGNVYGWNISVIDEDIKLGGDLFFTSNELEVCQPPLIRESVKLIGNGSIVNSVSCHPSLPYVITAGVEKVVRVYSPHDFYGTESHNENRDIRTEPDEETLEFFHLLVRREQFGAENYLWRTGASSLTDEGSCREDSECDSYWNSSSDDGMLMEEYDNDSNISAT